MSLARCLAVLPRRVRLPVGQVAPSPYGHATALPSARPTMQLQTASFASSNRRKKKGAPSYPKYKSKRKITVIENPSELEPFCKALLESVDEFVEKIVEKNKDPVMARCIGFDVEYSRLEGDPRRKNLPAMIQMASPARKGPVGLIWIDKFPNHGQDILQDEECDPLRDILQDSSLFKVGLVTEKHFTNLASWFGINESIQHPFSGDGVIEREVSVPTLRLADMSERHLGRNLPRIKEKLTKEEFAKKTKRIWAVWRRPQITHFMREYAANDASCSVDIWLKIKNLQLS